MQHFPLIYTFLQSCIMKPCLSADLYYGLICGKNYESAGIMLWRRRGTSRREQEMSGLWQLIILLDYVEDAISASVMEFLHNVGLLLDFNIQTKWQMWFLMTKLQLVQRIQSDHWGFRPADLTPHGIWRIAWISLPLLTERGAQKVAQRGDLRFKLLKQGVINPQTKNPSHPYLPLTSTNRTWDSFGFSHRAFVMCKKKSFTLRN